MQAPPSSRESARRRGAALIELALATPLLLLLLAGALDFAMVLRTAASVADAARAGAQYGSLSATNASNTAGIQTAAINAAPGIAGMTAAVVKSCQCAGGGAVSCSGSCAGGMLMYVQVTAQAAAPTVFNYSGLSFSGLVSSTVSMRAQ